MSMNEKQPVKDGAWDHQPWNSYVVTGVDTDGRRFKRECKTWPHANGVNVYRGTKWLVRAGRRHVIQRIYN